jgi:hypothetical protein
MGRPSDLRGGDTLGLEADCFGHAPHGIGVGMADSECYVSYLFRNELPQVNFSGGTERQET